MAPDPEELPVDQRAEIEARIRAARELKHRLVASGHPEAAHSDAQQIEQKARKAGDSPPTPPKPKRIRRRPMNGHATVKHQAKNRITLRDIASKSTHNGSNTTIIDDPDADDFPPTRVLTATSRPPIAPEDRARLDALLPKLPRLENQIMRLRLGLDSGKPLTQRETARVICKSSSQTQKLEARGRARLLAAGLDVSEYLPGRWPRKGDDDVLPLPSGPQPGRDNRKSPDAASEATNAARRAILRALIDLPADAASVIIRDVGTALGITL